MPYWKLLTHMSIRNAVVCGIIDPMRGNLPGTAREAISVGAVIIRSLDDELVSQCFGPGCPILAADDATSCFDAMQKVLAMGDDEFARLQQTHMDWAGRYLHYERNVDRMLEMLRDIAQGDAAQTGAPPADSQEARADR